ncbi:MAG: sensor histidine kinase [Flavisolibacter sp.]
MNQKWYRAKWISYLLHFACWALLFSLPYLLRPSSDLDRNAIQENHEGFLYLNVINRLLWVALFYLNSDVIVPRFLYRKKYWYYGICLLCTFIFLLAADWSSFSVLIKGAHYHPRNFFSFNIFPILFVLTASTAYRMILDQVRTERKQKEKENENLKTELSLLRSQVSPHFMFNVLNNMVALARFRSEQLEPSLIKLSSLMRYMLYETDEKVSLQKEIEYLQSYIDLQQQRFGKNVQIQVSMDQVDASYEIEPMLLIPFVENAFKHGTGLIADAAIRIELKAIRGILSFSVCNKYNQDSQETKDKTSGIGLTNVKRRLNLLYGKKQKLEIKKTESDFSIHLQIQLTDAPLPGSR